MIGFNNFVILSFFSNNEQMLKNLRAVCETQNYLCRFVETLMGCFSFSILLCFVTFFIQMNTTFYTLYLYLINDKDWNCSDFTICIYLSLWMMNNGLTMFFICSEADYLKQKVFVNFIIPFCIFNHLILLQILIN